MMTRDDCVARDKADKLSSLRDQFDLPDGVIYLDGNSLGARPKVALSRVQQVVNDEWGKDLIRSWNKAGWFDLPSRLGDKLATLIGANPNEVVVTDSTSINLFKTLAAALHKQSRAEGRSQRHVIVTERANFPTDVYIAQGLTSWLDSGYEIRMIDSPDQLNAAIDEDTAVVMLTHVNYRTGHMHDMREVSTLAHARGALMLWDLAHSAGAVPVNLNADGADYAVGCTYKYLNGGPGSPAFIWVAAQHQKDFRQPLSGWWSHASPFAMQPQFEATGGIRRALCGTQPIASLAMVECGLDIFAQTSMAALREKSLALTDLFIDLVESRCRVHPLELVTPREHAHRGSQVSFAHPHGYPVMQALISRGVIGDYREPHIMRFGFTPLYTRFIDVWDAVDILVDILDNKRYDPAALRDAVT
ncbi:kynureninase [Noviherbaspirillum sp. Root189]|uniref:kynureninase n=1 Tax=Noviherbaspirillum sp. Root189 TaxID=1736487 RepID=UPI00070AF8B9|nr:kynureninase [Noviherbaspirillum sp. Root189]KRB88908.1 kynureninase [Noviherbaspirillum sp. Root189]